MNFRNVFLSIGLVAGLGALAFPVAAQTPVKPKDDLVIGVAQFPSSLHPAIDALVIKSYVIDFAIRQLTAFDPKWENTCLMCATLPTLENGLAKYEDLPGGGKGIAVTFKLKPDLAWGDGVPVTAKDFEFTWKLGRDPNSGFTNAHPWSRAKTLDVVDDHTVVLHLDKPVIDYNQWDALLPEHIEAPIYAKAGDAAGYLQTTAFNRAPTTPGLWNGPYLITNYQSGVQIVLEPNPHWAGTKPGFRRIVIKLIENTAALQANLLSGDIDMVAGEGVGLTIDQVIALRKQHPDQFEYVFKPSLTYEHIDLKIENPVLQDLRVRQALLYAMDRKTLTSRLFEGMQPVADTWVNPLEPNHSDAAMHFDFDLAKSKALLAAAGWKPGAGGICVNDKGEKLSLELMTTAGNRLRELTEQVLQNQWKAACIDVTLRNEPPRTLFGETTKKRLYSGMVMYGWSSNVGASPRATLGGDMIPTQANNFTGSNYIALDDPTMNADIGKAETELDPAKQKVIWAEMQKIYAEQTRVLPLFFRAEPHVVPKWLKGYAPTGHGDMTPLWAENWHPG